MIFKRIALYVFILLLCCQCIRKNYFQTDARYLPTSADKLAPPPAGHTWAVIAPQYNKNKVHKWIWGTHYRTVWATPVLLPELDARKIQGGLTPLEIGGGMQTTSLTLTGPDNRLYTLRTLDKDPSKALPEKLAKTFLGNIMRDQTSAGNPYAAFTLPPLMVAAGIFHTNPKMYYVPLQEHGLGEFGRYLAGKVVMLEEKFKGKTSLIPAFAPASDLVDSDKMLKNRYKSNKYQVDQLAFARARLFDVLIADWDRHEGQWNWLEYPDEATGQVHYKPVPKDRDQTYYRFDDGFIPWLVSRKFLARQVGPFRHNVPDVQGLIYNARFIDNRFLNEVTAAQWAKLALEMKTALNEALLTQSVALFPDTIYQLEGKRTLSMLKARVACLPEAANQFYQALARKVTVAGSDEKEYFLVRRLDDQTTLVAVHSLEKEGEEAPRKLYYRVFNQQETKEITLHGLGEDDEFLLEGDVNEGIKIIINGGLGADKITDKSVVKKGTAKTLVYDTRLGNNLNLGKEARNKTTPKVSVHSYDREGY